MVFTLLQVHKAITAAIRDTLPSHFAAAISIENDEDAVRFADFVGSVDSDFTEKDLSELCADERNGPGLQNKQKTNKAPKT